AGVPPPASPAPSHRGGEAGQRRAVVPVPEQDSAAFGPRPLDGGGGQPPPEATPAPPRVHRDHQPRHAPVVPSGQGEARKPTGRPAASRASAVAGRSPSPPWRSRAVNDDAVSPGRYGESTALAASRTATAAATSRSSRWSGS